MFKACVLTELYPEIPVFIDIEGLIEAAAFVQQGAIEKDSVYRNIIVSHQ